MTIRMADVIAVFESVERRETLTWQADPLLAEAVAHAAQYMRKPSKREWREIRTRAATTRRLIRVCSPLGLPVEGKA